jgi:hypothetical protein
MIGLFGRSRPDHPMADARSARRILEELPRDPVKALEELGHWHESVSQFADFRPDARTEVLLLIDAAAEERVRKVTREYLAPGRLSRFQENRLWTAANGYWRHAGLALARAVDLFVQGAKGVERAKPQLPLLLVSALRALAQQILWAYLRYGPHDPVVWGAFNRIYGYAEAQGLAQAQVTTRAGALQGTTPQLEYLRGLMLSAGAPESLLPAHLVLAEKLVGCFVHLMRIRAGRSAEVPFWTDVQGSMVPLRASRLLQPGAGVRFFGAGAALGELEALRDRLRAAKAPQADLGVGAPVERDDALELLEHLLKCWSPQAPARKHQRHAVKSRLDVANGWSGVLEALDPSASLSFDGGGMESWVVENASAGGFGALVAALKGDWLRVGVLVAMQPEGGNNWLVGIVRRVQKTTGSQARVGVETLAHSPEIAQFSLGPGEAPSEIGVLLRPAAPGATEVRIALRPGVFAPGHNLECRDAAAAQRVFVPTRLVDRGEDYEIARFRELVRDG